MFFQRSVGLVGELFENQNYYGTQKGDSLKGPMLELSLTFTPSIPRFMSIPLEVQDSKVR